MSKLQEALDSIADLGTHELFGDEKMKARKAHDSLVQEAADMVHEEGLDKIRCSLTGAPYATVHEEEIHATLHAELKNRPKLTAESLVDKWQLRALTLCSNVNPALRSANKLSLDSLANGVHGNAKVINYCLSRLFFPPRSVNNAMQVSTNRAIERMQFAAECYDYMTTLDNDSLAHTVMELVTCDSYAALSGWQSLRTFRQSVKDSEIAEWFAEPESFSPTIENLNKLTRHLMHVLCAMSGSEHGLPNGDSMTKTIFDARLESMPMLGMVSHDTPETVRRVKGKATTPEEILGANAPEWYKTLSLVSKRKFATSATHGPGYVMGSKPAAKQKKTYKDSKTNAMMGIDLDLKL